MYKVITLRRAVVFIVLILISALIAYADYFERERRNTIDDIAFDNTLNSNGTRSADQLYRYLNAYPNSRHRDEAQQKYVEAQESLLADAAKSAEAENSVTPLLTFLKVLRPVGDEGSEVNRKIDKIRSDTKERISVCNRKLAEKEAVRLAEEARLKAIHLKEEAVRLAEEAKQQAIQRGRQTSELRQRYISVLRAKSHAFCTNLAAVFESADKDERDIRVFVKAISPDTRAMFPDRAELEKLEFQGDLGLEKMPADTNLAMPDFPQITSRIADLLTTVLSEMSGKPNGDFGFTTFTRGETSADVLITYTIVPDGYKLHTVFSVPVPAYSKGRFPDIKQIEADANENAKKAVIKGTLFRTFIINWTVKVRNPLTKSETALEFTTDTEKPDGEEPEPTLKDRMMSGNFIKPPKPVKEVYDEVLERSIKKFPKALVEQLR